MYAHVLWFTSNIGNSGQSKELEHRCRPARFDSLEQVLALFVRAGEVDFFIHIYSLYIYICYPRPETHIFYDFTTKDTVSCCFCSRCETSPHRPRCCMTPPAGKVLVQVLFLPLPLLSVSVSVFLIRIVISIIIITNTITITAVVLATISTSITILIAK